MHNHFSRSNRRGRNQQARRRRRNQPSDHVPVTIQQELLAPLENMAPADINAQVFGQGYFPAEPVETIPPAPVPPVSRSGQPWQRYIQNFFEWFFMTHVFLIWGILGALLPNRASLRVMRSRVAPGQLGLFSWGPPGSSLPAGTLIPFLGYFVKRFSPHHLWSPWHAESDHHSSWVFIPHSDIPLPGITEYESWRYLIPWANYVNTPWRPWVQHPGPHVPHRHSYFSPDGNSQICFNLQKGICYLRTTLDIPNLMEVLFPYEWFVLLLFFSLNMFLLIFYHFIGFTLPVYILSLTLKFPST